MIKGCVRYVLVFSSVHHQVVSAGEQLVLLSLVALGLEGVHPDLLVVLLKGGHVLASLRELALLHALANIPSTRQLRLHKKNIKYGQE